MVDRARIAAAVSEILSAIGEDPERPGLVDTPRRVADEYAEFFSGVGVDPVAVLGDAIPSDGSADAATGDLVVMRDIDFRSICEHHLVPFVGRAQVAYLPAGRLVGLGRVPVLIDTIASRPQLQERLTEQIADALQAGLGPAGVMVVLDAVHQCVTARGPRQMRSSTVTIASRGRLTDPAERAAVLTTMMRGDG